MISLRSRLMLSYASVVAIALILLSFVVSRLVFTVVTSPIIEAVAGARGAALAVVADHGTLDDVSLRARIRAVARRPGVIIMVPPPNAPLKAPPADPTELFSLRSLLGLQSSRVMLPDGSDVRIGPDVQALRPSLTIYLSVLATAVALSIVAAWLIAKALATAALKPLIHVTDELERFSRGDFTPSTFGAADRSEIGRLATAYNGAAAQVVAALAERAHGEEQMRRFVADAGHELRTPLTVVSAYLDILERDTSHDALRRERALATMRIETNRIRRLVERLVALVRLERPESSGQLEPVDVGEIAAGAVAEIRAARFGDVVLTLQSTQTSVLADPGDVHAALVNVIDNAIKYGAGSRVMVDIHSEAENVVVRVRDDGPGIEEAERERIFERFFRGEATKSIDGSGLGLSIVQRALERSGGCVRLEDAGPGGTIFALALPMMPA